MTILPPAPSSPYLDGTDVVTFAPAEEPTASWGLLVELTRETVRPGRYSSAPPESP